ncbi:SDR family oxidoreductase [Leucobacter sp. HY1910]
MERMKPQPTSGVAEEADLSFPTGQERALRANSLGGVAPLVLVFGATGYVGGRLVPRLLAAGYRVRVLTRDRDRAAGMPWASQVEIRVGDAADSAAVRQALRGVDTLYFLVHSMTAGKEFAHADRMIARNVIGEAASAHVQRAIYLGGLHPRDGELSEHLASRVEVGDIFLCSGVSTIVLQAGVIIGSGSASFEMVRHLTEVLPYMPAPRWVRNFIQPIAIRDVLYYLLAAARIPDDLNRTLDIGGPDVLRYGQMMNGYALEAGLPQRHIASLPVLTPRLASHWVGLVTPVPRQIARPLVESLQHDCVMLEHDVDQWIERPEPGLTPYRRAVKFALGRIEGDSVETSWVDARVPRASSEPLPSDLLPSDPGWSGRTVFTDERTQHSRAAAEDVWSVISQIGGAQGWHSPQLLWSLRGVIDRLQGGVGLKRGRRSRVNLRAGDAVDVWRVEQVIPNKLLRLRAEMRVPGQAWLEFGVEAEKDETRYWQRATFIPQGLAGRLYWFSMLPFHGLIFRTMSRSIVAQAEKLTADERDASASG